MPEHFEIYVVYKKRYINTLSFLSFFTRYIISQIWSMFARDNVSLAGCACLLWTPFYGALAV